MVQINVALVKLNGTHQLLVYADDVNILGGRVHTVQKNKETLLFANRKTRIEVNADKTKYVVMSGNRNAGRSLIIKSDNISFERVQQFKNF